MTHRHFGLPGTKPRDTYTSPSRPGSLSATAFMSGIVVIMIALGVILYGVSKTITDAANTPRQHPARQAKGAARRRSLHGIIATLLFVSRVPPEISSSVIQMKPGCALVSPRPNQKTPGQAHPVPQGR